MKNVARHCRQKWTDRQHESLREADELTWATRTVRGLTCGTTYRFRVRARGDGAAYAKGSCLPAPVWDARR